MDALDRNITAGRGARFFRDDDGEVQFEFVLDPTNRIGPRPALRADQDKHGEAWAAYVAALDATEKARGLAPVALFDADMAAVLDKATADYAETFNGADPAKFDHDGDGAAGGSLPKATADRVAPRSRAKRTRRG